MRKVDTMMKILVRALVRWSWLLAACLVTGVIVGKILAAVLLPTYQSTSVVQLDAQTRTSQAQIIQPIASYGTLVTSDSVLDPVLRKYSQLDRQTFISKQLVVTPDTLSQSLQIQVTLPQAKVAAAVANDLAQLLVTQQNAYIKSQYEKAIQLANQRVAEDQKSIDNLNQQYAATPASNTAVLSQLSSQIDQERNLQNADVSNQQALITEQALYDTPLTIVLSAVPSPKPSSILGMIPFVPVMIGLFLVLGVVAVSFLEQNAQRINETYTLQQKTSIPVLGALRWATPMPLPELCQSKTPYAEDCRLMMADILFQAEGSEMHIIAMTALRSDAGTSAVTAHLGAFLAQSNRRVLLIDANLYQPSLHERVGVSNEAGLALMLEEARKVKVNAPTGVSNYSPLNIVDKLPIDGFIKPTNFPNLYILPAGKPKASPGDLLSMPEMGQFLKWASKPIDFVIIDCPALDRGDAHVLGALSDQALVVVDATKDRIKQVATMKDELANSGVKLAGLIVNKLGRWI
jgi:Mrp family chromosome partitioning ATPase/uncharacterized protein involved in exopolysaccharide biosynthesis